MNLPTDDPSGCARARYVENEYDNNFIAHVGWEQTSNQSAALKYLFSEATLNEISRQVSNGLQGVNKEGKKIVVPNQRIAEVLSTYYRFGTRTDIGDIRTKDVIPPNQQRNDIRNIINQTINTIVKAIRDEYEIIENNKKLSKWDTVLGDFNRQGLRQHAPIKLRKKHVQHMAFQMNY